jgi:hypothetical protein
MRCDATVAEKATNETARREDEFATLGPDETSSAVACGSPGDGCSDELEPDGEPSEFEL